MDRSHSQRCDYLPGVFYSPQKCTRQVSIRLQASSRALQSMTVGTKCRYEIYAFSKAQTALAFAAYPFRRHYQHKFRRDSARHVKDAVKRDLERQ